MTRCARPTKAFLPGAGSWARFLPREHRAQRCLRQPPASVIARFSSPANRLWLGIFPALGVHEPHLPLPDRVVSGDRHDGHRCWFGVAGSGGSRRSQPSQRPTRRRLRGKPSNPADWTCPVGCDHDCASERRPRFRRSWRLLQTVLVLAICGFVTAAISAAINIRSRTATGVNWT